MEKKNGGARGLAVLICAVMIFAGVCIGGYRYAAAERVRVMVYFDSGDGTQQDLGMRYLLDKRIGQAYNLLSVASRYTGTQDGAYADVANAVTALENAQDPNKAYA